MRHAACLSVLLLACDASEPPKPAPVAPPTASSAPTPAKSAGWTVPTPKDGIVDAPDQILAAGAPSLVRVVEPGAEPRTQLRYAIPVGAKQTADMHMVMELEVKAKGNDVPKQAVPEIIMRLVLEAGPDGHVDGVLSKVLLEPKTEPEKALAKQMAVPLGGIQGLKVGYTMTPEGRVRDVKIAPGSHVDAAAMQMVDQLTQSLDTMVVPLPTEPVGVGAVWQVLGRIKAGVDMLQYTRFTLKKKDAAVIELASEVTQLAAARTMVVPGSNATGKLEEFKSSGHGTVRADLGKLSPEQARANVTGHVVSSVAGVGSMSVDTGLELSFAPVK